MMKMKISCGDIATYMYAHEACTKHKNQKFILFAICEYILF